MIKYDISYFINKFEAIPENEWCTDKFHNEDKSCALGHCEGYLTGILVHLTGTMQYSGKGFRKGYIAVVTVNDGRHPDYQQDTPKKRVLAFLYDLKAKETPQLPIDSVTADLNELMPLDKISYGEALTESDCNDYIELINEKHESKISRDLTEAGY